MNLHLQVHDSPCLAVFCLPNSCPSAVWWSGGSVMALSMLNTEKLDSAGRDSWPSDQAYLAIWGEPRLTRNTWIHQKSLAVRVVPHLNLPSSTSKVRHSLATVLALRLLSSYLCFIYFSRWVVLGRSCKIQTKHPLPHVTLQLDLVLCSWCLIGGIGQKTSTTSCRLAPHGSTSSEFWKGVGCMLQASRQTAPWSGSSRHFTLSPMKTKEYECIF